MTGDNEQPENGNSSEFSDDLIHRFLLGDLSASEQDAFAHRLLTDHALARRVRLAELELADDYAYERLSGIDKELLEETLILSADRARKVRVSRSLRDQFAVSGAWSPSVGYIARFRPMFSLSQPAWRFAFGVVILLILFGAAWLVIREPRIAKQIVNRIVPRRSPAPHAPREASHPNNTSAPEHQTTSSPMPVHDQTAGSPMIVSVALLPAVAWPGDATSWVNLPPADQDIVRLHLALTPDQPGRYRAELLTIDGQSVFSAESIKAQENGAEIHFDVPARLLKSGNYQIRLSGDNAGAKENVVSYYLRIAG